MRILLTNDDGIQAEGLLILAKELSKLGEVYVAAPATEQSGASHGLTAQSPLRAWPREMPGVARQAWAVTGTPADCVKLAMEQLLDARPDLVVSGINHGPNLATDTIYSGTVAGGMEGYLYGVPSVAVSVVGSHRRLHKVGNFSLAARVAAYYGGQMVARGEKMFLNINVPGSTDEEVRGVRFCPTGWRWYTDAYARREDPFGRPYFWMQGEITDGAADGNTDVELCGENYITITPLHFDLTDHGALSRLREQQLFPDFPLGEK